MTIPERKGKLPTETHAAPCLLDSESNSTKRTHRSLPPLPNLRTFPPPPRRPDPPPRLKDGRALSAAAIDDGGGHGGNGGLLLRHPRRPLQRRAAAAARLRGGRPVSLLLLPGRDRPLPSTPERMAFYGGRAWFPVNFAADLGEGRAFYGGESGFRRLLAWINRVYRLISDAEIILRREEEIF